MHDLLRRVSHGCGGGIQHPSLVSWHGKNMISPGTVWFLSTHLLFLLQSKLLAKSLTNVCAVGSVPYELLRTCNYQANKVGQMDPSTVEGLSDSFCMFATSQILGTCRPCP